MLRERVRPTGASAATATAQRAFARSWFAGGAADGSHSPSISAPRFSKRRSYTTPAPPAPPTATPPPPSLVPSSLPPKVRSMLMPKERPSGVRGTKRLRPPSGVFGMASGEVPRSTPAGSGGSDSGDGGAPGRSSPGRGALAE